MAMQKAQLPIILTIISLASVGSIVFALLSSSQIVSNTGNVKTIGVKVYKDAACSQTLSSIDWGTMTANSAKNYMAYVRNEGTVSLTLSKTTGNWNPAAASGYMALGWNREGYILTSGASVQAVFTLTVFSNVTGVPSFTFDITLTGTEGA
jgi:hypothetical protein